MSPSSPLLPWISASKRRGIGWGFPNCWQGWAVLTAWVVLIVLGTVVLRPDRHPVAYAVYDLFVSVLLVLAIIIKGEPARWRWGDDSDQSHGRI